MGIIPPKGVGATPKTGAEENLVQQPQGGANRPPAGNKGKASNASQAKTRLFNEGLEKLPPELRTSEGRGSKVETLEFVQAIGLSSRKSTYTDKEKVAHSCPEVIGAIFQSTEPVKVPRVPVSATVTTGIDMNTVEWEEVQPNTPFVLSMMDAMIFLTQPEYSNRFMFRGEADRASFSAKFTSLDNNSDVKLPTPHFLIRNYQFKAEQLVVDEQVNGEWKMKAGYERFAELLVKQTASRSSGGRTQALMPNDVTAIAVRELLGLNG